MSKKIKFIASLFTVICMITFLLQGDLRAQNNSEEHVVQQGETLFSIARNYNVTVNELLTWNQLSSDNVSPGQVLRLQAPQSENRLTHTVAQGETLYSISRAYGVTIAEVQLWNNISGTLLETGQELVLYPEERETETLPPPGVIEEQTERRQSIVRISDSTPGNAYYTVRSGDTLTKIAREHDMTLSELRQLNDLSGDNISVGQRLTVRQSRSTPSVAESSEDSTPQGKFVIHRVENGETGESILERFQMSEAELTALNPGVDASSVSAGQRLTVLLPPNRSFPNPFRKDANLEDLGSVQVITYSENAIAGSTTSGELYNPDQLTAAHSNMALGNVIYIENPSNGQGIYVRINDRHSGEGLKLSQKAFEMLGFNSATTGTVRIYLDQ